MANTLHWFKSQITPLIVVQFVRFVSSYSCDPFLEIALDICADKMYYISSQTRKKKLEHEHLSICLPPL